MPKLTAQEIEEIVRTNLYKKVHASWSTRNETRVIVDEKGNDREFWEPSAEAMLLMAKYYEIKYGIKIIVVTKAEDLDAIKKLVDESEKSKKPCKFGFVLPNNHHKVSGFFVDAGWNSDQPFSDLNGKLITHEGHVCPVIYEKLPDGRSSIIALDSIGMVGGASTMHKLIIEKISASIPVYTNKVALQRGTKGCRDLSILMLKDALRISNLVDELGFQTVERSYFGSVGFDMVPEELLKPLETGAPWKTANSETPILHSSQEKKQETLREYSDRHRGVINLGDEEMFIGSRAIRNKSALSESEENTKLLKANELMVGRIVRLCEFYGVDSKEGVENLVQKLSSEQFIFPPQLPSDLPDWSRAEEWKSEQEDQKLEDSVFETLSREYFKTLSSEQRLKYREQKQNYQYLRFIAQNLESESDHKKERAQRVRHGLVENIKYEIRDYFDIADISNDKEVLEMLLQGEIVPIEKLFTILPKEKTEYTQKDAKNFSRLAYAAVRGADIRMIKRLAEYQKNHNFAHDWNEVGDGESLPLIHLAASLEQRTNFPVSELLLAIEGVDPTIKVGDAKQNAAQMCTNIFRQRDIEGRIKEIEDARAEEAKLKAELDTLENKERDGKTAIKDSEKKLQIEQQSEPSEVEDKKELQRVVNSAENQEREENPDPEIREEIRPGSNPAPNKQRTLVDMLFGCFRDGDRNN